VMLNGAGELACAAAANLFWVSEGRLYTPALHCGVLDGIMRAVVLRQAELAGVTVIEAHEGAPALARAEAVFVTNSLIGVRAVSRFDGQAYQPNALVERLAAACANVT
jgi:branched-subunit amino acid aminotransferase/4-amino-4-deoxychorismate lyase